MSTTPLPLASAAAHRSAVRVVLFALSAAAALTIAGCGSREPAAASAAPATAAPNAAVPDPVAHGEYLVKTMGCNDCHTPWKMGAQGPEPDMSRMLSGHPQDAATTMPKVPGGWMACISPTFTAFAGPFGISYAANLTPDATGLGAITEKMFTQAIRDGKHYGTGRPILPPMPWMWYRNLTDEDLHAMWSYLQTIPKIENTVPQPVIAGPPPGM